MIRRVSAAIAAVVAAVSVAVFALPSQAAPDAARWIKQVGTYDYLLTPDYDGLLPLSKVVGNTTIGLGTFDHLDGELVLIGGTVYRVGTDGVPREASLATTTPFFQGVRFAPQASTTIAAGTQCSQLVPLIDALMGTSEGVIAVRMTGSFSALTTRSVPRQEAPYAPLPDVVAQQTTFPFTDERATLVGFRTGNDAKGIGAPGLHLHGLTSDRSGGGHVLSCTVGADLRLQAMRTRGTQVFTN